MAGFERGRPAHVRMRMAVLAVVVAFCVLNPASALATTVLTPVPGSPFATSTAPGTVVFSPSGKLLAIDTGAANSPISVLSVGPDGALTQVPGSPFPAGTGGEFGGPAMAFNPSGSLLAIGNVDGDTVSVYSVSAGGALTQAPGSPFEDLIDPVSVAFSPSGSLLATADTNGDFTLWAFSVAADGTLAPVPGSPFSTGNTEVSVAFSPSGALLATIEPFNDSVSVYSVGSDGSLTELSTYPLSLPSGDNPLSVAFSPSGAFLARLSQFIARRQPMRVGRAGFLLVWG